MLDINSMSLDECRAKSRADGCPCCGEGVIKVWHPRCNGQPTRKWRKPNGDIFMKTMVSAAYCKCSAGLKVSLMHQASSKDIYARMPNLQDVETGGSVWIAYDPTESPSDMSEIVDPSSFRAAMSAITEGFMAATRVEPIRDVRRHPGMPAEVRRMTELEHARSMRPVQDNYDVRPVQRELVAAVSDDSDSDVPF